MRSSTWRLEDLRNVILNLGFVGENLHTRQIFDCKKMFEQYPNASVSMTVTPPEGEPYPGTIERDGDMVIWDVMDSDLVAEGDGEIQLVFTQEPHIARSYNARTHICRSQVPTGSIPSGLDDYITRADQLLDEVKDTFPAGGTTGQVLAKKSDEDYDTEWVPQGTAEDLIDDTAGDGDTDKTWSADKLHDEFNSKANKYNTVFTSTLSRGRREGSTVGKWSYAFGDSVVASGKTSHAEGFMSEASGENSHAEGHGTLASNARAHAEGYTTQANGANAHAEGYNTKANGPHSHAEGNNTIASHLSQHVFGEFNIADNSSASAYNRGNYVEIVGNGTGPNTKSNARTLDWDGNEELAGDLTIKKGTANEVKVSELYKKPATGIPASDLEDGVIPDPEDLIDDTAGEGDTDKVWSADKSHELLTEINSKQDAPSATGTAGQVLGLDENLQPEWKTVSGGGTVDSSLSKDSTNPVQNKVITGALEEVLPVTNDLSQWLYGENKYIDSSYNLVDLTGYNTYRIPCDELDFVLLTWTGDHPFQGLNMTYYYAYEDGNGMHRDLTNRYYYNSTSEKHVAFIAPNGSVAIYFTFKVANIANNVVIVKNNGYKYSPEIDYFNNFAIPVNANTSINPRLYITNFDAYGIEIRNWENSSYKTWWLSVKAGDKIEFVETIAGMNFNACYLDSTGTRGTITGTTHTFTYDAIVVAFEASDKSNTVILIRDNTKLKIKAEDVFGLDSAVSTLLSPINEEISGLDSRTDNIEHKFEGNDVTYSSGNTSGYYKIVNDEITLMESSSFTCQKVEVYDWMKGTIDYQIVSLAGINEAAVFVAFADENDEYISKPTNAVGSFRTPIPSNAKYIYLSFYGATWCASYTIPANKIIMTKDMDDLYLMNLYKGMNGVAFGTSLTYRAQTTGGFLQYLPDMSGITFDNQGIGSATILGNGGNLDMLAAIKAYSSYSGKSVCLLEGFVNDWYQNKTLGTWKDTAETTVCGCVRSALNYILSQNAYLTVFLILDPYGRNYDNVDCRSTATNSSSLTQYEYYEEIAKVAESLGIPVIREYAESQISENTPQYLLDNIHPNARGAEQSARIIWMKMKQYLPNV